MERLGGATCARKARVAQQGLNWTRRLVQRRRAPTSEMRNGSNGCRFLRYLRIEPIQQQGNCNCTRWRTTTHAKSRRFVHPVGATQAANGDPLARVGRSHLRALTHLPNYRGAATSTRSGSLRFGVSLPPNRWRGVDWLRQYFICAPFSRARDLDCRMAISECGARNWGWCPQPGALRRGRKAF